jgi:hypothetical protein
MSDKKFYLDVLKSEQCQCESPKKRGQALCYSCFRDLPADLQREIYRPLGNGFEEAYEGVVEFLKDR